MCHKTYGVGNWPLIVHRENGKNSYRGAAVKRIFVKTKVALHFTEALICHKCCLELENLEQQLRTVKEQVTGM